MCVCVCVCIIILLTYDIQKYNIVIFPRFSCRHPRSSLLTKVDLDRLLSKVKDDSSCGKNITDAEDPKMAKLVEVHTRA